jgi:hypothetical protein
MSAPLGCPEAECRPALLDDHDSPGQRVLPRPGPPALLLLTALGLALILLAFPGPARGATDLPNQFSYDFRGRPVPPEATLVGEEEGKYLHVEPEGLRITLPRTWIHPWGGVGFKTSFVFRGDFEVTTAVEILEAETPPSGYGVGVGIRVNKADPSPEGATLGRMVRAGGRQVLVWDRSVEVPGKAVPETHEGEAPCTDKVVRLRLKREGATLSYLWAPGAAGGDFQEIHQEEFGAEDIKSVWLTAKTGRQPCNVDVRLLDLRIRSGGATADVPGAGPPGTNPPAAGPPWAGWKVWLAVAMALAVAVGTWLAVRQRRRAGKASAAAGAPGTPAEPGAASAPIAFPCPGCGKKLRAGAPLAGKQVKCPQCARAVLVPGTPAG